MGPGVVGSVLPISSALFPSSVGLPVQRRRPGNQTWVDLHTSRAGLKLHSRADGLVQSVGKRVGLASRLSVNRPVRDLSSTTCQLVQVVELTSSSRPISSASSGHSLGVVVDGDGSASLSRWIRSLCCPRFNVLPISPGPGFGCTS